MDIIGQNLLAHPGFAGNDHGNVCLAYLHGQGSHLAHLDAVRDEGHFLALLPAYIVQLAPVALHQKLRLLQLLVQLIFINDQPRRINHTDNLTLLILNGRSQDKQLFPSGRSLYCLYPALRLQHHPGNRRVINPFFLQFIYTFFNQGPRLHAPYGF